MVLELIDLISFCFVLFLWGLLAALMADRRGGNVGLWFILGCCSGPIAVLIAYGVVGRICLQCKRRIHNTATVCPHCHRESDSASAESKSIFVPTDRQLLGFAIALSISVIIFAIAVVFLDRAYENDGAYDPPMSSQDSLYIDYESNLLLEGMRQQIEKKENKTAADSLLINKISEVIRD